MSLQFSVTVRNARADVFETTVGVSPLLRFYSGSAPVDCATTASGTKLVEITCPADWMNDAASGSKTKKGTWSVTAIAAGTGGYWRIYDSTGTTCHAQGTLTNTGGGGDMTVDNTNVNTGQTITINTWTLNEGNA